MVDIWVIYGYYMVNDTDNHFLVGDIPTPLKNMKVNGIFLPSIWKNMFPSSWKAIMPRINPIDSGAPHSGVHVDN